ncbi:hypothetical protein ACFO0N_07420 [Halobium salinum]|uniref:Dolichyl-phosphate-mannose-protein mannosyltransferase n=1 Tax=Halobium salinum TaxID=1364940 RepID=A0ABD5PAR9_9EURY|nr:hypothetical protein [Halobium salinum]
MGISSHLREFDRVAAGLGLVAALALLPLPLFISHIYAKTIPVVLGLASLAYLLGQRGETREAYPLTLPTTATHALPSLVLVGSGLMLVVANLMGSRTPTVLVIGGVTGILLMMQVAFADDADLNAGVILLQTLALGFALRFSAVLTSPMYVGLDVWEHVPNFTQGMLEANSLSGMGATKYVMAPLFHLLIGAMSMLGDVSLRTALILTVGVGMVVSVLFVYYTAEILVPTRWALLGVVLFTITGSVIRWGMHLIPSSLGLAFFLAILYLIVRVLQQETGLRDTGLLLFFFLAMALTHQVSAFILLVFLGAGWVTRLIISTGLLDRQLTAARNFHTGDVEAVPFGGYFAFNLGLLTLTWSLTPYYGKSFLATAFEFLYNSAVRQGDVSLSGPTGGGAGGPTPTLFQEILLQFDAIGFLLFFFGTTVGCLYAFRKGRATQAVLTLVAAVVVMTAFTLLPPVLGVGTFLSGRWFAFLYAIMAVVTAIGFDYLNRGLSPTAFVVLLLVFTYAFPMVMVASPKGVVDDPVVDTLQGQYNFDEQDLAAGQFTDEYANPTSSNPIGVDNPWAIQLNEKDESDYIVASVPEGGTAQEDRVLYRTYQTDRAPVFGDGNPDGEATRIYRVTPEVMCQGKSVMYANGDVMLCSNTAV